MCVKRYLAKANKIKYHITFIAKHLHTHQRLLQRRKIDRTKPCDGVEAGACGEPKSVAADGVLERDATVVGPPCDVL